MIFLFIVFFFLFLLESYIENINDFMLHRTHKNIKKLNHKK